MTRVTGFSGASKPGCAPTPADPELIKEFPFEAVEQRLVQHLAAFRDKAVCQLA